MAVSTIVLLPLKNFITVHNAPWIGGWVSLRACIEGKILISGTNPVVQPLAIHFTGRQTPAHIYIPANVFTATYTFQENMFTFSLLRTLE
jgi:hypothetical protein